MLEAVEYTNVHRWRSSILLQLLLEISRPPYSTVFYIFEANCPKFKILKNTKTPEKIKIIHFMLMLIFSDKMLPNKLIKTLFFLFILDHAFWFKYTFRIKLRFGRNGSEGHLLDIQWLTCENVSEPDVTLEARIKYFEYLLYHNVCLAPKHM